MDKAEILEKNGWVATNIDDFAQRVKGIPRDRYPPLRCLACERPVHDSGLVTLILIIAPDSRIQRLQRMENFVH